MHVPSVRVTLGPSEASRNWTTASEVAMRSAIDILIWPLPVTGLPGWYKCGSHGQRRFRLWTSRDMLKILQSSGLTQIV